LVEILVICCAGLLSKSIGQTLRVAASVHVLFGMEDEEPLPNTISYMAIKAAIDFVEVCCQQTAYIAGRGTINDEINLIRSGEISACTYTCCSG